jgi:hypothetical protein
VTANIIAVVLADASSRLTCNMLHHLEEVQSTSAREAAQQHVDILHYRVYQHGAERPHKGSSSYGVDVINITPTKKKSKVIEGLVRAV